MKKLILIIVAILLLVFAPVVYVYVIGIAFCGFCVLGGIGLLYLAIFTSPFDVSDKND
ncbi:MAG: hypothetical protein ACK5NB_08010 [Flavobacteriaceae bacterium]